MSPVPGSAVWIVAPGALSAFVGLTALVLSFSRKKRPDLHLLSFGSVALLYGIRLLITMQIELSAWEPGRELLFIQAALTYIIPVPLTGFISLLFGRSLGRSLLWAFRLSVLFAVSGILSDAVQAVPMSLQIVNSVLVILWAAVVAINAVFLRKKKPRELKIVLAGFSLFGLFALNENLVDLGMLPWRWKEEWIGFLLFLASLGFAAGRRFFASEERVRELERELDIARRIQSSILPAALPAFPELGMAVRYVPMAGVAGDFYDVLISDGGRFGLLVADVSGHGLGAALLASMLKIAFAAQEEALPAPARVLSGINRTLRGKMENNFVTAACLFIDLEAGVVRSASAGHPPFLICRKGDGGSKAVGENGLILGPFPNADFPETVTSFGSGDRIVVYTDGVTETRHRRGVFFGEDGLERVIRDRRSLPHDRFADALLDDLRTWSGRTPKASFDDDLTLVVVDRI
jgi:sigma-B regulation protein RsbU (phosphoserine phosphatase)